MTAPVTVLVMTTTEAESFIAAAVQKYLKGRQVELTDATKVVSLDQAAKLLKRRREDVRAMILSGELPAENAGKGKTPRWKIKVSDLTKVNGPLVMPL